MNIECLNSRQLDALTVNLISMVANVTGNTLVIYLLTKTNQTARIACKLTFTLSISDFLVGAIGRNLFTALICEPKCSVIHASLCVSTFLAHLSSYTIAITGIDRYISIKYYTNFRTFWTAKVVISLICAAGYLLSLLVQAITLRVALTIKKVTAIIPIVMDGFIVSIIILLQLFFFFLSGFSFTNIHDSGDSRGRGRVSI